MSLACTAKDPQSPPRKLREKVQMLDDSWLLQNNSGWKQFYHSVDQVFIHNYVLGLLTRENTIKLLQILQTSCWWYLTYSFALLPCANHIWSDGCFFCRDIITGALFVSNDGNLNLLQWHINWQGLCRRESMKSAYRFTNSEVLYLNRFVTYKDRFGQHNKGSSPSFLMSPQPVAQQEVALWNWLELLARQIGLM